MTELIPVAEDRAAAQLAALRGAIAAVLEQGRTVNIVYAPTTITHHAPPAEPAPAVRAAYPVPARPARTQDHPGIDVDLTGYGAGYAVPGFVSRLPEVPESRSWAPLILLTSGWSGLGAAFAIVVTGSVFAIVYVCIALVVSAAAFVRVYRDGRGAR